MNLPKPSDKPALTQRPVGVEIYTDLLRNRRFVRLAFRRRDLSQAKAQSFLGELIADLSAAGLVVASDVEISFSLDNIDGKDRALQTRSTRAKALNVKVEVRPSDETRPTWKRGPTGCALSGCRMGNSPTRVTKTADGKPAIRSVSTLDTARFQAGAQKEKGGETEWE